MMSAAHSVPQPASTLTVQTSSVCGSASHGLDDGNQPNQLMTIHYSYITKPCQRPDVSVNRQKHLGVLVQAQPC